VVSFGTHFQHVGANKKSDANDYKGAEPYELNDNNVKYFKDTISEFNANFGGT
jgi:hypothetical protein